MTRIAVISDLHIDLKNGSADKECEILRECFGNMEADSVAVCGDVTENGLPEEWDRFFETYSQFCKVQDLLVVPGNMDAPERQEGKQAFLDAYTRYAGKKKDAIYFGRVDETCALAGISHEADDDDSPLSEAQIAVLEQTLWKAARNHVPALVFSHYIMNDTINIDWKFATLGSQSLKVKAAFQKWGGTVLCFSGHIHRGLISEPGGSVITMGSVTYVSTPSICRPDNVHYKADNGGEGTGYLVEIGPGFIKIGGHDFLRGARLDAFQWAIPAR